MMKKKISVCFIFIWNFQRSRFFDLILTSAEWPPKNNNVYTFAFHPREGQFSFNHLGLKMESISNLVVFEIITYGFISTVMYNKENKKITKKNQMIVTKFTDLCTLTRANSYTLVIEICPLWWVALIFDSFLSLNLEMRTKKWVTLSQKTLLCHFYMIENLPFVVNWLNSWLIFYFKTKKCKQKSWVKLLQKVLFNPLLDWETETQNELTWLKFRSCSKYFVTFFHYSCVPYLEL